MVRLCTSDDRSAPATATLINDQGKVIHLLGIDLGNFSGPFDTYISMNNLELSVHTDRTIAIISIPGDYCRYAVQDVLVEQN